MLWLVNLFRSPHTLQYNATLLPSHSCHATVVLASVPAAAHTWPLSPISTKQASGKRAAYSRNRLSFLAASCWYSAASREDGACSGQGSPPSTADGPSPTLTAPLTALVNVWHPPATAVLGSSGGARAGNQVTTPSHCSSALGPAWQQGIKRGSVSRAQAGQWADFVACSSLKSAQALHVPYRCLSFLPDVMAPSSMVGEVSRSPRCTNGWKYLRYDSLSVMPCRQGGR